VEGTKGCPILKDCIAALECQVKHIYDPGNHTLFVGEILEAKSFSEEPPLNSMEFDRVYIGKS
jgi:flavin reductase (DIM6/NTAB) family NADH-FMN oxidoreductase RutF